MNDPTKSRMGQNDYLWDGSGEPDPEVQKLEGLLRKYRQNSAPAGELARYLAGESDSLLESSREDGSWFRFWPTRLFPIVATAIAIAIVVAGAFLIYGGRRRTGSGPGWEVSSLSGAPRIAQRVFGKDRRWGVGELFETDDRSSASLKAEGVGQIEVEPSTRLRLLTMGALKRIALDRGTIHAFIWSPPGEFVVDTPSATTVDLGCAYTLHVDNSGAGTVRTTLGWVGFKLNGRESFTPAGAACATRPKIGPGTPYFEDSSAKFQSALAHFDFESGTSKERADDLDVILALSRKRDALTLWHLLSRVDEDQRAKVYERLTELAPPPGGVTKDGILRLDQPMLDLWWNTLGFDDISVWRRWEHSWSDGNKK